MNEKEEYLRTTIVGSKQCSMWEKKKSFAGRGVGEEGVGSFVCLGLGGLSRGVF